MNDGQGEITKIVKSLAKMLQVDLTENWQRNHSDSIHKNNADYTPPIFNNILIEYKNYAAFINEKNSKKEKNQ